MLAHALIDKDIAKSFRADCSCRRAPSYTQENVSFVITLIRRCIEIQTSYIYVALLFMFASNDQARAPDVSMTALAQHHPDAAPTSANKRKHLDSSSSHPASVQALFYSLQHTQLATLS